MVFAPAACAASCRVRAAVSPRARSSRSARGCRSLCVVVASVPALSPPLSTPWAPRSSTTSTM
eukprot:7458859-Alexandrium_andersonii.AAC.1